MLKGFEEEYSVVWSEVDISVVGQKAMGEGV